MGRQTKTYRFKRDRSYRTDTSRVNSHKHSFFPRTARLWNNLPHKISNSLISEHSEQAFMVSFNYTKYHQLPFFIFITPLIDPFNLKRLISNNDTEPYHSKSTFFSTFMTVCLIFLFLSCPVLQLALYGGAGHPSCPFLPPLCPS